MIEIVISLVGTAVTMVPVTIYIIHGDILIDIAVDKVEAILRSIFEDDAGDW